MSDAHSAAPHDAQLGHHGSHHATGDAHDSHHVNYFAIFVALLVCTALSVIFDLVPLNGKLVTFLVLAVATAKATFVMTYFMHLKFEKGWKFVILLPTAILAVGLMVALMPDVGLHYYTRDVPQVREYEKKKAEAGAHGDPGHPSDAPHEPGEAHKPGH